MHEQRTELEMQIQEQTTQLAQANAALQAAVAERQRAERVARGQKEVLVHTLNVLSTNPQQEQFLGQVLVAVTQQLNVFSSALYFYDYADDTAWQYLSYYKGQVLTQKQQLGHPVAQTPAPIDRTHPSWEEQNIYHRPAVVDIVADTSFVRKPSEWREWLLTHGVKTLLLVPLMLGDKHLGTLSLRFSECRLPATEEVELAQALAHQTTLAIQLTRLTEQVQHQARQRQAELEVQVQECKVKLERANQALRLEVAKRQRAERLASRQAEANMSSMPVHHPIGSYPDFTERSLSSRGGMIPQNLHQVLGYIEEHLHEDLKLAELANLVGLSPQHFSRCFRNEMGSSPYQYAIGRRVAKAKDLLRQTRMTIGEIAFVVGFQSPSHFSKQFRQLCGMAPSEYRRGHF